MGEHVNNRVHTVRMKHGMTQEELAEKVAVSRQTIHALERGNYAPSIALALRLAKCFKVPVEDLFSVSYEK